MIWGWGVAQYPYLLPQTLTISAGAGAPATLQWLVVVVIAALHPGLPSTPVSFSASTSKVDSK